jgi:hypothetical protein
MTLRAVGFDLLQLGAAIPDIAHRHGSVEFHRFGRAWYAAAIEAYGGRGGYYLDAAAWAALGHRKRATALLRERLGRMSLSGLMDALMRSLLALLEGRAEEAVRVMDAADTTRDPEILVYFARQYSKLRRADSAVRALKQAAQAGFVCAPQTLISDAWLSAVRGIWSSGLC